MTVVRYLWDGDSIEAGTTVIVTAIGYELQEDVSQAVIRDIHDYRETIEEMAVGDVEAVYCMSCAFDCLEEVLLTIPRRIVAPESNTMPEAMTVLMDGVDDDMLPIAVIIRYLVRERVAVH